PSAEEISEEFEAFLASLNEEDSKGFIHTDFDDREGSVDDRDLGDDI
ncbi:PAC2 family protein, partial [Corynebacterium macginleyi]|nr:PAC2 family protein [Corynebacterium macginleyi]